MPPLVLTGTRVTYHLEAPAFDVVTPAVRPAPTALALALRVVRADGSVDTIPLGVLPDNGVVGDQEATVTCADGCRITGIGIQAPASKAAVTGSVTVSRLTVDGRPVELAEPGTWRDTAAEDVVVTGAFANGGLTLRYSNNGADKAFLPHASVPEVVPALTTPASAPSAAGATFGGSYVDGTALLLSSGGSVPFVPGGPPSASMVNLDNLLAQGWRGRGSAVLSAYVDTNDPATVARVTSGWRAGDHGVRDDPRRRRRRHVRAERRGLEPAAGPGRRHPRAHRRRRRHHRPRVDVTAGPQPRLRRAAPGRSATTGLSLMAKLETGPVIVVSALLGAAVGLWAAPAAVGMVPLFTTPPPTFPVDLHTAWLPALVAGAVGVVVLTIVGLVTSRRIARRASLERLRETV